MAARRATGSTAALRIDCLAVIEEAYAPALSDEAWLENLLAPFEPMALGSGVLARMFRIAPSWETRQVASASRGVTPERAAAFQRFFTEVERCPPIVARTLYAPPSTVCWASHRIAKLPPSFLAGLRTCVGGSDDRDALGVVAIEPRGFGVHVRIPVARNAPIPPRTFQQLTRVTAHLSSAIRLRALAGATTAGVDHPGVEAILDPGGRVRHATGPATSPAARAGLAAAVRGVERARGRLRRSDPDEALAIWTALFEGRWSLVEHVESDGRRLLLARRNEPGIRDPRALLPAERDVLAYAALGHSNKYIAYLLGAATSTVASRLGSALRKLGLSSRREAIDLLGLAARESAAAAPDDSAALGA